MMTPDDAEDLKEKIGELCSKLSGFLEKENVSPSVGVLSMLIVSADAIKDYIPHHQGRMVKLFLRFLSKERENDA